MEETVAKKKIDWLKIRSFFLNEKFIFGALLAIAITIYNFVWISRTYTMSEGWYMMYVGLMDQGKKPYVDFYYYMPPLNLLYDYILVKMSGGVVLVYRIFRLIERIIAIELLYWMMIKRVNPWIAATGCFLGSVLMCANNYFLSGDYNTSVEILAVLICFALFMYHENIEKESVKKYAWATAVGLIGGLMFLIKQTIFLASVIVLIIFYVLLIVLKVEKHYFKFILFVAAGAIFPIAITMIILLANHSFTPFINQVFIDTGSKGSLAEILFIRVFKSFWTYIYAVVAIAGLMVAHFLAKRLKMTKTVTIIVICIVLALLGLGIFALVKMSDAMPRISDIAFVVMVAQLALILAMDLNKYTRKYSLLATLICTFVIVITSCQHISLDIYNYSPLSDFVQVLVTIIFDGLFLWVIYHILYHAKDKQYDVKAMIFVFATIASGYSSIMSNGAVGVVTLNAMISIPTLTYIAFRDRVFVRRSAAACAKFATAALFVFCLSQKMVVPYSWWGDTEGSYWNKTETVNIKQLTGMKFTPEEKQKYEALNYVVGQYADENSIIWAFPYGCVYNIFQDNYNLVGVVPVLFYDVCPESFAIQEAETLATKNPDIVVWVDIPTAMYTHEYIYQDGRPLGQRHIQKWFSDVKDTNYTLVGQASNVFIYKLNDGKPVTATYIEDPDAVNVTSTYPN